MKKTMFSLLMLAAMFMIASCGSKSNSGEATEATQEQVKEVTFTDPAITYNEGLDLTSYFSAESLTQPGLIKNPKTGMFGLSTNVKLKVLKKFNLEGKYGILDFEVKYCDENGSTIDKYVVRKYFKDFNNWSEGTVITLNAKSEGEEVFEDDAKKTLDKVKKIEVSTITFDCKFAETTESNE